MQVSLAASTKRTYASGQRRYLSFCSNTKVAPLPTLETTLCKFVAFLAHENLKHQTIKTYLSAVRNLQITAGHGDPFQQSLPLLEYVLRGIKSDQAKKSPSPRRTRLPIKKENCLRVSFGHHLLRASFVNRVQKALKESGIDADKFSGHSFRIGAASTAAARGVEDSLIKMLGRWESSAHLLYIQVPRERLAGCISKR